MRTLTIPPPEAAEFLDKLTQWLTANRHPDVFYVVTVCCRTGESATICNMSRPLAAKIMAVSLEDLARVE